MAKDRQEEAGDLRRKLESVTNAYANTLEELDETRARAERYFAALEKLRRYLDDNYGIAVSSDNDYANLDVVLDLARYTGWVSDLPREKATVEQSDPVKAPAHYAGDGTISCMDAMRSMVHGIDLPPMVTYWWGCAFKYLWRWPWKNKVQDLEKAKRCIDYAIGEYEHGDE